MLGWACPGPPGDGVGVSPCLCLPPSDPEPLEGKEHCPWPCVSGAWGLGCYRHPHNSVLLLLCLWDRGAPFGTCGLGNGPSTEIPVVRTGNWLGSCVAEAEQRGVEVKDFESEVVLLVTRCFPDQETEQESPAGLEGRRKPRLK